RSDEPESRSSPLRPGSHHVHALAVQTCCPKTRITLLQCRIRVLRALNTQGGWRWD
ncbi:Threonine--tRNA ligase, partial [Clarias magur]